MNEMITEDGEVVSNVPALVDTAGLSAIVRAEIDTQVATARQYPRNLKRVINNITTLATMDEETSAECLYALVRGGKKKGRNDQDESRENKAIEGPSIRLAEIAAQCYGNCRIEARVVQVNRVEKFVEAVGTFHDLETNMASSATVRRRISTKYGQLFSDDMIIVTGNAACSIAKRNAILAGIPRGVYRNAYQQAREVVAGTASALSVNRDKALKAFAAYGVTPVQIFEKLGVEDEGEITRDHVVTLRGMFSTIKNAESTVEEMFGKGGPTHDVVSNPLKDETTTESTNADAQNSSPAQTQAPAGEPALSESAGAAKFSDSLSPPEGDDEAIARMRSQSAIDPEENGEGEDFPGDKPSKKGKK